MAWWISEGSVDQKQTLNLVWPYNDANRHTLVEKRKVDGYDSMIKNRTCVAQIFCSVLVSLARSPQILKWIVEYTKIYFFHVALVCYGYSYKLDKIVSSSTSSNGWFLQTLMFMSYRGRFFTSLSTLPPYPLLSLIVLG